MAAEPVIPEWASRILSTATSLWQAFVVPPALGAWVVYKFRAGRSDAKGTSDLAREQSFMDRLQARIATQDAENAALRKELAEERASGLRWMNRAQLWCQRSHQVVHDARNALTPGGQWREPNLPDLEDIE